MADQNAPQTAEVAKSPDTGTTALVQVQPKSAEIERFELKQREARLFALSGLFADIKGQSVEQSIAQAFVKIALGESMGFNPAESMTGIDLIQGRVAISANMRASRMQAAGFDWDILQLDEKGCRLRLKYKGQILLSEQMDEKGQVTKVPTIIAFTEQDATRAGLIGKDNYKKNPKNMYFARAITNAQRWYAPSILSMNILSVEEAQDLQPPDSSPAAPPAPAEAERVTTEASAVSTGAEGLKQHLKRQRKQPPPTIEGNAAPASEAPAQDPPPAQQSAPAQPQGQQPVPPEVSQPKQEAQPTVPLADLFAHQPARQQTTAPPPIDYENWND